MAPVLLEKTIPLRQFVVLLGFKCIFSRKEKIQLAIDNAKLIAAKSPPAILCVDKMPPIIGGVVHGAIIVHAGTKPLAVAR